MEIFPETVSFVVYGEQILYFGPEIAITQGLKALSGHPAAFERLRALHT